MDAQEQGITQEALLLPKSSKLALASLVLGVMSFLGLGPVCSVPGIIAGHLARRAVRQNPRGLDGGARAATGLWLGYINLVCVALFAIVLWPSLEAAGEAARRAECQGNLKQFGFAFRAFSDDDSEHRFPELSNESGKLVITNAAPGMSALIPQDLPRAELFTCPNDKRVYSWQAVSGQRGHQETINHSSYVYLGYLVTSDSELEVFAKAYKERLEKGLRFDTDLDVPPGTGTKGGGKILRLCAQAVKPPPEAGRMQSTMPVMWDRCIVKPGTNAAAYPHFPGANVLFSDGHVEFIRYPEKFPITETACRILSEIMNP
jgi:prepilin-type processing-associated H-X9-DG protein